MFSQRYRPRHHLQQYHCRHGTTHAQRTWSLNFTALNFWFEGPSALPLNQQVRNHGPWGVWDVSVSVWDLRILADNVAGKSRALRTCGSRFKVIRCNLWKHKWLSTVFWDSVSFLQNPNIEAIINAAPSTYYGYLDGGKSTRTANSLEKKGSSIHKIGQKWCRSALSHTGIVVAHVQMGRARET